MLTCNKCGQPSTRLSWLREKDGWCPTCFHTDIPLGESAMVATDSIPGGYAVQNGLCHQDGTPRKFYSKSEIRRAAFEAGWTIAGETPKPNQRLIEGRRGRL